MFKKIYNNWNIIYLLFVYILTLEFVVLGNTNFERLILLHFLAVPHHITNNQEENQL